MNIRSFLLLMLLCATGFGASARSELESERLECVRSAAYLAQTGSTDRKYAPDRDLQIQHLLLDITPNFAQRTIQGKATIRFSPMVRPVGEIRLDAVELQIESVTASEKIQAWQVTESQLVVNFAEPIPPKKETTLTISYAAEPQRGLYFRTPEMGYREGDTHLFTQGEAVEGRYWYPCLDTPNQQFTSEVICRVPEGMMAISNGRLLSEEKDPGSGLKAFHWLQDKKHANYLVSLTAGFFKKIEDTCEGLPLAFFTPPSEFEYARTSFQGTKDMIQFFQKEIGIPYPWDKYYQVCVNDFVAGGMENTSVTTLTDGTLFPPETENIRTSEGLVAHELAHQWFGDLVTCKDWSHLWLNEGFATYYETLWNGHHNGRDAMLYELYDRARNIVGQNDTTPIVRRSYGEPDQMFGYLVYPKAGWVLHMLRCELGDDLYRESIKTYLERNKFENVVTEDLRRVIEQLSGRSFDQFFDQWLYHGHLPELEIAYSWDESSKLAKVSVQQVQEVNSNVLLFNIPLKIRFKIASGPVDREIRVTNKQEDFYIPLEAAPEGVRIDPKLELLARIKFTPPASMWRGQLTDPQDVVGRILAVESYKGRGDQDAIDQLRQALNQDQFYGVRIEASRALRAIHKEAALEALIQSAAQPDARARKQVVDDIGGFYDQKALAFGLNVVAKEKNPEIVCTALRDIAGYGDAQVPEVLRERLQSTSFRNEIANAAVAAMRAQDDPAFIVTLLETLTRRETAFTSHGFAQALGALSHLTRNESNKEPVREFLARHLASKKRPVQLSAISALGTLGDTKAIPALEKFAQAGKDSPQRTTAERALTTLRAERKPADELKILRQEVLGLQKEIRELRKNLDEMKSKAEAQKVLAGSVIPASAKAKVKSPKVKD